MDIEKTITEFVSRKFLNESDTTLSRDDSLLESGILDSAGIFELVSFMEEKFGISVNDEEIVVNNFDNVASITRLVQEKQG